MSDYDPTIQPAGNGWHSLSHSHIRIMIPAAETVIVNGWHLGNPWVDSKKWTRPRQIRRVEGGLVYWAQWFDGELHGSRPVRAFPADVHRVVSP